MNNKKKNNNTIYFLLPIEAKIEIYYCLLKQRFDFVGKLWYNQLI